MEKCGAKSGREEEPIPKKHQNLGKKLWKISGKRGGHITPVLPFPVQVSNSGGVQDSSKTSLCLTITVPVGASARQIGATVWELHQYNLPFAKIHNSGAGGGSRRNHTFLHLNHHNHHHHLRQHLLEDSHDPSPDLGSASSLRRHVAASLMQHYRTVQRNHNPVGAVSPPSYSSSSMEVAPYNPTVTLTSSIEFKGANGEKATASKHLQSFLLVLGVRV